MFTWRRHRDPFGNRHSQLIRILAERSAAELFKQLDAWPAMEAAELRGYARARVGASVRRQLRMVMAESEANEALPTEIVALASERAVHLVVREQLLRSQLPVVRRIAA